VFSRMARIMVALAWLEDRLAKGHKSKRHNEQPQATGFTRI
jgi:hypothetical protein